MIDLSAAGLSETEAKTYAALLKKAEWKPAELAQNVSETRTNCYKILDKFVGYGLAEKFDKAKKIHYRASNPSRLLELAHEHRTERENAEKQLELNAQDLITQYVKTNEQPGVRFFQGKDELEEIFRDQIHVNEPIHYLHTIAGIDFYTYDKMHNLRMLAVNNKIPRHALTPDTDLATMDYATTDAKFMLHRTWLRQNDYTAPVEWGAYGDKLYIISYGTEAQGMIIESPQIATAFRQIYALLERGQKALPDYEELPKLAKRMAMLR